MASLSPGQSFGRYEIEILLGTGGMGEVYRARDTKLRRKVALKVIRRSSEGSDVEGGLTDGVVARFTREAQTAASLAHPNVVTVFDVGDVDGTPFIAMELLDGITLRASIHQGASLAQRLRWLLEIAKALHAAHGLGLVHRDVKPDNVMVCNGHVKVLDFGIAKWVDDTATAEVAPPSSKEASSLRTGTGHLVGTPRYMAPEQTRGRAVDASADQFAWGLVAYEVLAGQHPHEWAPGFARESDWSALPRPLAGLVPELPFGTSAIVMRTLQKWPPRRFASMAEVIEALEPIVAVASAESFTPAFGPPESATTEVLSSATTQTSLDAPASVRAGDSRAGWAFAYALAGAFVAAIALVLIAGQRPALGVTDAGTDAGGPVLDISFSAGDRFGGPVIVAALAPAAPGISECYIKHALATLHPNDRSGHRVTLTRDPSGIVTESKVFGIDSRNAELQHCVGLELLKVKLPPSHVTEKIDVWMTMEVISVPNLRGDAGDSDASARRSSYFIVPTILVVDKKARYDEKAVDAALAPLASGVVDCLQVNDRALISQTMVLYRLTVHHDARGGVQKVELWADQMSGVFTTCAKRVLARIVLPPPKGNVADKLVIDMSLVPQPDLGK